MVINEHKLRNIIKESIRKVVKESAFDDEDDVIIDDTWNEPDEDDEIPEEPQEDEIEDISVDDKPEEAPKGKQQMIFKIFQDILKKQGKPYDEESVNKAIAKARYGNDDNIDNNVDYEPVRVDRPYRNGLPYITEGKLNKVISETIRKVLHKNRE
jgi:hypothetical protein